jgi:hypothetical protein
MPWASAAAEAHKQVDQCIVLAKKYVLPWYGASEAEFPRPIPPAVGVLYTAHESSTKWTYKGKTIFAPARFILTNYPEASLKNLTCRVGDDEVGRFNVHPYDVRSHHWAAQQAFWEGRKYIAPKLRQYGFVEFDGLSVADQLVLLLLQRAVGIGCTRGLLRMASLEPGRVDYQPVAFMERWLQRSNADTSPFDGSQTTDVVRLRFAWCHEMVLRSREVGIGDLPVALKPPLPRPAGLMEMPADFMSQMKLYSARAKREGPMPTGPWPG